MRHFTFIIIFFKYFLRTQVGRNAVVYLLMVPLVVILVDVFGYASPYLTGGVNGVQTDASAP